MMSNDHLVEDGLKRLRQKTENLCVRLLAVYTEADILDELDGPTA
jgi:hypothetical protein